MKMYITNKHFHLIGPKIIVYLVVWHELSIDLYINLYFASISEAPPRNSGSSKEDEYDSDSQNYDSSEYLSGEYESVVEADQTTLDSFYEEVESEYEGDDYGEESSGKEHIENIGKKEIYEDKISQGYSKPKNILREKILKYLENKGNTKLVKKQVPKRGYSLIL